MRLASSLRAAFVMAGLLALASSVSPGRAQDKAALVKDLNTEKGADRLWLVRAGDYVFFQNYDPEHGVELWKTDGALEGSGIVRDIRPAKGSSFPEFYYSRVAGSFLYFRAEDGVHGAEFWRTDGTEAGTIPMRDIMPAGGSMETYPLAGAGSLLYFLAWDDTTDSQLWRTDGTQAGTFQLTGTLPGNMNLNNLGSPAVAVGPDLFFSATVSAEGGSKAGLWKSDGTAEGTVMIREVNCSWYEDETAAAVGSRLFFWGSDETHGVELWVSDGTTSGTAMVRDITPGRDSSWPWYVVGAGSLCFFPLYDTIHGTELWRSDGTASGTFLVKDIWPGTGSGLSHSTGYRGSEMVEWQSKLYFAANEGGGTYLWVSDGTEAGTKQVNGKDIEGFYGPERLTPTNSALYLFGDPLNIHPPPTYFGYELWRTDGTTAGTRLVKDIWPGQKSCLPSERFYPYRMPVLGSTVFFRADDGVHGGALWKSDGTAAGTSMVGEFLSGSHSAIPWYTGDLTALGPKVFFTVRETESWQETWFASDGTANGTLPLISLLPGSGVSYVSSVAGCVGSTYFFKANHPTYGNGLWKSDGTASGTLLLRELVVGSSTGTTFGQNLFFTASDDTHGFELWKSDGTSSGTLMVKDIAAGQASSLDVAGDDTGGIHALLPGR